MKKYYCAKCINENEDEIDYMSLKSNDIREAGKMTSSMIISQNTIIKSSFLKAIILINLIS